MTRKEFKHSIQELASEAENIIESENDDEYSMRVRCVLEVLQGKSTKEVAENVDRTTRTIENWITKADNYGFDSLRPRKSLGRKPILNDNQMQEVKEIVTETFPFEHGDNLSVRWTGKILSEVLSKLFPDTKVSARTCRDYLRDFEYMHPYFYTLKRTLHEYGLDSAKEVLSLIRSGKSQWAIKEYIEQIRKAKESENERDSEDEPFEEDDDDDDDFYD